MWFINGLLHREDGPAVIKSNGTIEWWINGEKFERTGPNTKSARNFL